MHFVDDKFPKTCYTLDKNGHNGLFIWIHSLRFLDGYASNMARCVDMKKHYVLE